MASSNIWYDNCEFNPRNYSRSNSNVVADESHFHASNGNTINRKVTVRKTGSYSYVDLITNAILTSQHKQLTANEIYECLIRNINLDHSPSSLKNTIRHTLSWYKRFKRVQRGTLQKPAWWTVDLSMEPVKKASSIKQHYSNTKMMANTGYVDANDFGHHISQQSKNSQTTVNGNCFSGRNTPDLCSPTVSPLSYHIGPEYKLPEIPENSSFYQNNNQHFVWQYYGGDSSQSTVGSNCSRDCNQHAAVVTDNGNVCDYTLPDPLQLRLHSNDTKETQTTSVNYQDFHQFQQQKDNKRYTREVNFRAPNEMFVPFGRNGRTNHSGQLCVAPLPADLATLNVNSGRALDCDIVRVVQHEIDLEGKFDFDCLNNFDDN